MFLFFIVLIWLVLLIVNLTLHCWTLVPGPGIELSLLTVKAQSPNHWTAREFPPLSFFFPN